MKIGVAIEETWDFFHDVYSDLERHHNVTLFKRKEVRPPFFRERINRYLFRSNLEGLLKSSDVVFFEWTSHLLVAATHLPKTCGIVTRLHRYEMYQWVDKINWEVVDKIIFVSEAKRREFLGRYPDQESKTAVIPVGVALDKFKPGSKQFAGDLGILCHLTPRKRVYDLIMTFYELIQESPDFHLHIAGGPHIVHGDYYEALHTIVQDLQIEDKVTFYGNVTDTWNWYHKIDIFISNSYSEGLQVAPMEAMASGCYCLSHRWAGADELFPEENLFFTSRELREKILLYHEFSDEEKQRKKSQLRQLACSKLDVDRTKLQIRKVIEEVGISFTKNVSPK